jgi:glycine cleavage system aminomethyltransferase T
LSELSDAEQKSPLDEVLRRHGATMTTRRGRCVAAHFGSMAAETAVCTSTLGIVDRFDRTTLMLWGEPMDLRLAFSALDRLPRRAWSSPLSSCGAIVRCERAHMDACLEALLLFEDTVAIDVSDQYAAIGIVGPRAAALIDACGFDVRNPPPIVLEEADAAFEVLVPAEHGPGMWEQLLAVGGPLGITCVGVEALEHLAVARRPR